MLKKEKRYQFRERMREIHKKGIRDFSLNAGDNDYVFADNMSICLPKAYDKVIYTAANDFVEFLMLSMNVSAKIEEESEKSDLILLLNEGQTEDYIITFSDKVTVSGKNCRALAQALYCLEDKMKVRHAPYIKKEEIKHTFMFSPRMVHSGYALDEFPDEHLSQIAHAGMDAILLFVKDVNYTTSGFLDFNELIGRASKYGIDVYAYSYLKSEKHPEDEGAQEFYDNLYGRLFRECPGFRGVILVGESVGFPSKDTHVAPRNERIGKDGIPHGKPRAGFWPCYDFPLWLDMVKKSIYKYKADADIVFWTYNWGYVNEEDRIKLIEALPTDISLMATFEMFESYPKGKITQTCADYTLAFEGPGKYFTSEAIAAKKRGVRLYTMANTGGMTWDIGTIPYEPFPNQWMRRHEGMRKAHKDWGLCGVMDSHHFGFYPSFIGDLAKQNFILENDDLDKNLTDVLKSRFGGDVDKIKKALLLWSEAIRNFTPTDADQYGAFRVGPAYPLCLIKDVKPPAEPFAHFGNRIMSVSYPTDWSPTTNIPTGRGMLPSLRVKEEIKLLGNMLSLMEEGLEILSGIENPCDELLYLINLGKYIACCTKTGICAKKWYMTVSKLRSEFDSGEEVHRLLKVAKELLLGEKKNAESAIELVENDSRLGYEPSMDYMADKNNILWKLRHLQYVLDYELKFYENASDDKWWNK